MKTQEVEALIAATGVDEKDQKEAVAKVLIDAHSRIDRAEKQLEQYDGKQFLDTAAGQSLYDKVKEDLKAIRDEYAELKAQLKETENEIIKMKSPAAVNLSPEENTEKSLRAIEKIFRYKAIASKGNDPGFEVTDDDVKDAYGEKKAVNTLDIARAGAILLPETFVRELIEKNLREITNIRPYVRTFRIPTQSLKIPTRTAHGVCAWHSEGSTRTKDETLTFGTETITLFGANAYFDATLEMLQYSAFPLLQLMNEDYTEGFSALHGTAFTTGSGVGKPEGFMTNGSVASVNQEHASSIDKDDYIRKLYFSLKAPYRANARWTFNSLTAWLLSILKDGVGQNLLRSFSEGAEFMLMGKPVIYNEDMPDVGAGAYPILIADWKKFYTIAEPTNGTMTINDPYTSKATGTIEYMMTTSIGGKVTNPEAGKKLKIAVT